MSEEELLLLHTQEHINLMQETACMKLQELAKKQDDFRSVYLHPGSYQAACLAAGSVLQVRIYRVYGISWVTGCMSHSEGRPFPIYLVSL